ncbi:MAG: hypothetical protein V1672_01050, partial [Candidatus Diapherotrites archaeon]
YSGYRIPAKTTFRVFEKIKITDYSKIPNTELFGLSVTYIPKGANNEKKVITSNNVVSLSYAFSERRKFQIELLAGTPNYCLGGDGQVGGTGEGMAPRVKFDWDWDSWAGLKKVGDPTGVSNIGNMMSCDKEGPNDKKFYFCDPTQFTITVVEKLKLLENVIENYKDKELIEGKGQGEELVTYLTQFQTYLIGDNYNDDFKQDFVSYYLYDQFYSTPDYFNHQWYKYLYNNGTSRIRFQNRTYDNWVSPPEWFTEDTRIVSGLYDVTIKVNFDDGVNSKFFISGEPTTNITVELVKSYEYSAPVNPLYFMPFNGNVGISSENGRVGYGIAYTYDQQPLILTEKNQESFELRSGTINEPLYTVETKVANTFNEVNKDQRGALLTINISDEPTKADTGKDGTIIFSPSKATPVFVGALSNGSEAGFYYYITKNGVPLTPQVTLKDDFMTYWSGDAATYNCADFENKNLPINRADSKYLSTGGDKCAGSLSIEESTNAFGFNWSGFPVFEPDPKVVIFHTIFYTPDEQAGAYQLHNACSGTLEDTSSIFLVPTERTDDGKPASGVWVGNADNRVIPLEYSSLNTTNTNGTKTIQQVFDLIEEERACLTVEKTEDTFEMKVWWNEAKLIDETAVWWRNEVKSSTGIFANLNTFLKEEQLQGCGRT